MRLTRQDELGDRPWRADDLDFEVLVREHGATNDIVGDWFDLRELLGSRVERGWRLEVFSGDRPIGYAAGRAGAMLLYVFPSGGREITAYDARTDEDRIFSSIDVFEDWLEENEGKYLGLMPAQEAMLDSLDKFFTKTDIGQLVEL